MTDRMPRVFRVITDDGTVAYGVEFPSGRVVVDHPEHGFAYAATAREHLRLPDGWRIEENPCPE